MCKKNETNAENINAMSIGADFIKLNHDYNFYEIGDYNGQTAVINCGNKNLFFMGGILVKIEEVK